MAKATNKTKAKKTSAKKGQIQKRIDWAPIKAEYISNAESTFSSLAAKYKVSKSAVQKRAQKEKWAELRQSSSETTTEEIIKQRREAVLDANKRHTMYSQLAQKVAYESIVALNDPLVRQLRSKDGTPIFDQDQKPVIAPVDGEALSQYTRSLKQAIEIERNVLGLPGNIDALLDPDDGPTIYDIMGEVPNASSDNSSDTA